MKRLVTGILVLFLATACKQKPAALRFHDGVYEGSGEGMNGRVPVKFTVEDGRIARIEIGENQETDRTGSIAIELIPERIIENQTPYVDVVTDATYTSGAIIQGVEEALGLKRE